MHILQVRSSQAGFFKGGGEHTFAKLVCEQLEAGSVEPPFGLATSAATDVAKVADIKSSARSSIHSSAAGDCGL